ncbi:MAG: nucleotidyltransferase domain-containing protein [Actinomycetota bacterium]|nr:nucleotidyltransferase domain-containing protein [Actinomycetota bacterium]
MIPEAFRPVIIDFVSEAENIPHLICAVLFGSVLTGEISKKSDIDILLLFDTDHDPAIGKEAELSHQIASKILKKYDFPNSFSFVFVNISDISETDSTFLWEVARSGIIIWAPARMELLRTPHAGLEPQVLVLYSMKGLKSKDKVALNRALFGYRVEKTIKERKYISQREGIVSKKGRKLGPGAVLLPAQALEEIIKLLKARRAQFSYIKLWI